LTLAAVSAKAVAMNYRHAFHAGNHGDVLKHSVLARVLSYFKEKQQGFALLDAHAGIGHYDLTGVEAFKTGEWRNGIGRLLPAEATSSDLLTPYLDVVRLLNPGGELRQYPGSPEIARQLLRSQDKLLLNELHRQDHQTLMSRYHVNPHIRISNLDASTAVKAALPFRERRGVVLIDPAFEVADETERVSRMVSDALRRMATVCLLIWYPVTTPGFADQFCNALKVDRANSALRLELLVRAPVEEGGLAGSGLVVVNPPWTLQADALVLLPLLASVLCETAEGRHTVSWLLPPK
jgi:23S rRNA (adenine2030-N6)-methyltransferase